MRILPLMLLMILALFAGPSIVMAAEKSEFDHWLTISKSDPMWSEVFAQKAIYPLRTVILFGKQKHFGGIDLEKLQKDISNLRWRVVKGHPISAGPDGTRTAATYSVKEKIVIVSLDEVDIHKWMNNDVTANLIALHEALGALGYRDEKYSFTTTITFMAYLLQNSMDHWGEENRVLKALWEMAPLVEQYVEDQKKDLRKDTPIYLAANTGGGGITGIGGGGDYHSATAKYLMAYLLVSFSAEIERANLKFSDVLAAILDANIETTKDVIPATDSLLIKNTQVRYYADGLHLIIPRNKEILELARSRPVADFLTHTTQEVIRETAIRKLPL